MLCGWRYGAASDPVSTWMGDRPWTGKPSLYVTSQLGQVANSAFHPYGVDKSSTNLPGWGEGTSVGWQIILCDPIDKWRPVVLR